MRRIYVCGGRVGRSHSSLEPSSWKPCHFHGGTGKAALGTGLLEEEKRFLWVGLGNGEDTCLFAQSCLPLSDLEDCPWEFSGKNTGEGCCFFLQGILLTQGWNPCLLLGRRPLSHLVRTLLLTFGWNSEVAASCVGGWEV